MSRYSDRRLETPGSVLFQGKRGWGPARSALCGRCWVSSHASAPISNVSARVKPYLIRR